MRIIDKSNNIETDNVSIFLTPDEADEITEKIDFLLSTDSNKDHIEISDRESKHKVIIVVPDHNNIEELDKLGTWIIYPTVSVKKTCESEG